MNLQKLTIKIRNATPRLELQKEYAYEKRLTKDYSKRDNRGTIYINLSRAPMLSDGEIWRPTYE